MSEPFKITGPGWYRQRNGGKAFVSGRLPDGVVATDLTHWLGLDDGKAPCSWTDGGRFAATIGESDCDIIAPWVEPMTATVWVNFYEDTNVDSRWWSSREAADRAASEVLCDIGHRRLACVPVNWTEGDGLGPTVTK